jgi:toxin-antitoxin system PIN domain toxin
VILVDANVLLYAYDTSFEQHPAARRWLQATLTGPEPVRLAWTTILAFLRIGTNPRAFERPLTVREAVEIASAWLASPTVAIAEPTERHWEILARVLAVAAARGPLVMDAHLATLAIEHGATLCTTDRDFARFPGLRLLNPLRERT